MTGGPLDASSVGKRANPTDVASRKTVPASFVVYKDGVTYYAESLTGGSDFSGTDAATVIQNVARISGTHFFKKATYPITSRILVDTVGDIEFIAEPGTILDASTMSVAGASKGVFTLGKAGSTLSNILFENFRIDMQYTVLNELFGIVNDNPVSRVRVRNVHTRNGYNGGISFNSTNGPSDNIIVENCTSEQEGLGVQFYNIKDGTMQNCKTLGSRDDAFVILATQADGCKRCNVIGCHGDWTTERTPNVASMVKIDASGIAGSIDGVLVEGCSCLNVEQNAVSISASGAKNWIIANNPFFDGKSGITGRIISTSSSDGKIVNNFCQGTVLTASIYIDDGLTNILVEGNDAPDSIRLPAPASAGIIALNNKGFNPRGWATTSPAVPASGVDETNTKGYPVLVYITGLGTGISAVGITDNAGTLQSFTRTGEVGDFYRLEPGDKIRLTYTGSPTWKWYGL